MSLKLPMVYLVFNSQHLNLSLCPNYCKFTVPQDTICIDVLFNYINMIKAHCLATLKDCTYIYLHNSYIFMLLTYTVYKCCKLIIYRFNVSNANKFHTYTCFMVVKQNCSDMLLLMNNIKKYLYGSNCVYINSMQMTKLVDFTRNTQYSCLIKCTFCLI